MTAISVTAPGMRPAWTSAAATRARTAARFAANSVARCGAAPGAGKAAESSSGDRSVIPSARWPRLAVRSDHLCGRNNFGRFGGAAADGLYLDAELGQQLPQSGSDIDTRLTVGGGRGAGGRGLGRGGGQLREFRISCVRPE